MKVTLETKEKEGQLFELGQVVATPAVLAKVGPIAITAALWDFVNGDWGRVDQEDWDTNDRALETGDRRLLGAYPLPDDEGNFWIITEYDRSVTTILLPSDY